MQRNSPSRLPMKVADFCDSPRVPSLRGMHMREGVESNAEAIPRQRSGHCDAQELSDVIGVVTGSIPYKYGSPRLPHFVVRGLLRALALSTHRSQ